MDSSKYSEIKLSDFKWVNEPKKWRISDKDLEVTTDEKTDYWEGTWYNFHHNSGHVYGVEIKDDFTFTVCVEAEFTTLYDQAGLMIYFDDKHWLKAGIEYNDGQPMISSVLTNELSDWGTGVFTGNPRKFYLRMSRKGDVACVKYSTDNELWTLLRLCPLPLCTRGPCVVGPMCCTPTRQGLHVKFSDIKITVPADDILHSN
ncbi:regulation of enolase protein 1-like [Spodoptera litura]|uniref:Regulation of enolase protein 1-like n=1 Tax=Spodoptera litura TaxID=69820 RepID=A0A9J7ECQ7_SPOLT|nr:regulation of enolase protein 1-like [Spodoptera litura]